MTDRFLSVFVAIAILVPACAHPGNPGGPTTPAGGDLSGQYAPQGSDGAGEATVPPPAPTRTRWAPLSHRSGGSGGSGQATVPPPAPSAPGEALRDPVSDSRAPQPSPPPVYRQESEPRQRIIREQPAERPGLGTVFGERMISRVNFTQFQRATTQPSGMVSIHYNDYMGLLAMARHLQRTCCGAIPPFRVGAGISVQLVDAYGRPLTGLQLGGRTLVMGAHGHRYGILIRNHTPQRWEIVASVDGLDVIDGQRAGFHKRGYVLAPWQSLHVQGFRTSSQTVAAFRFGSVRNSYAARTGSDRNVGVVGVAAYAEYRPPVDDDEALRRLQAQPFSPYAQPPVY